MRWRGDGRFWLTVLRLRLIRSGRISGWAVHFLVLAAVPIAQADICVLDLRDNGEVQSRAIFPNWYRVRVSSFDAWLCDVCAWEGTEGITGLTVVNFGTLPPGDIKHVYWAGRCGSVSTDVLPMTYAGTFGGDGGPHPAWTWAGRPPADFHSCPDLCGVPPCGAAFTIDLFASMGPCPADGATLCLGLPSNTAFDPREPGSLSDNAGCTAPASPVRGPVHSVRWASKVRTVHAGAGNAAACTIYYGKPGSAGLRSVTVVDSLPPGSDYVDGSGDPGPDAGWRTQDGRSAPLKWTVGPFGVTGGPTGRIVYRLSTAAGGSTTAISCEPAMVNWPDTTCGDRASAALPVPPVSWDAKTGGK